MSINARIKQKRIECGFTSHHALAQELGVAWQTVQLWEKEGGTAPNRKRMPDVARVLKTTPEWLLYGDAAESPVAQVVAQRAEQQPTLQWVYPDEQLMLSEYRLKTDDGKATLLVMARGLPNAELVGLADYKTK